MYNINYKVTIEIIKLQIIYLFKFLNLIFVIDIAIEY